MRNSIHTKLLSLLLCAALLLGLFVPAFGGVTRASAVQESSNAIQGVDFEDAAYANSVLEYVNIGSMAVKEPAAIITKGDSQVLDPGVLTGNDYTYLTTVKDEQLSAAPLKSFSFTLSMSENPGNSDLATAFYALYLDNGTSKSAAGLKVVTWSGQYFFRNVVTGTGITSSLAGGNLQGWYFNLTEKLTITVNYDYSQITEGKVLVEYVIVSDAKDSNGNIKTATIKDAVYTITDYAGSFPYPTMKPAIANSVGNIRGYYDDLAFTYQDTAEAKANVWYVKHSQILAKDSSTYVPATDKALWDAAFEDYTALEEGTKNVLLKSGVMQRFLEINNTGASPEVTQFNTDHAAALALTTDTATDAHVGIVNGAISAYQELSEVSKIYLSSAYFTLEEVAYYLKSYIPPRKDEYDTTPMIFDFNNGKNHFENITEDATVISELVPDPYDENNDVWHLKNFYTSHFLLPDELWADYTMPDTVTMRVYLPTSNPFARFAILLSYIDEENYSYINFEHNVAWTHKVVDGVSDWQYLWNESKGELDMGAGWNTLTIKYGENSATVTIVDANEVSVIGSAIFVPGGKFGFKLTGGYNLKGHSTYVDDISMTFRLGDFDLNDDVGKITTYYSGSNFVKPGETLFLSGEKLGKTVDEVYIMRLDNATAPALGYVPQASWQYDGMAYLDTNYTKDPAAQWNEGEAVQMDIIQRSDLSMNLRMPTDIGEGIYLLKLTPKVPGNDPAYVYVNVPSLHFASGEHGNLATAGGTVRLVGNNLNPGYIDGVVENATMVLRNLDTGALITVRGAIGFGDNSALEFTVPAGTAHGKYAAYLHTGYGDGTCYSVPVSFEVGADPRDSWSKAVFNVRDFGAKGDGNTNDTPAFMAALQKAYEMGGGVVYVPTGSYRVLSTLVIPEKVHLKGEDNGNTMIFWTARRWAIGDLPDAHIRVLGNCEISGIYFYGTRLGCFLVDEGKAGGNIYIHDIRMNFVWRAGSPTNGGGTNNTGEMSYTEIGQLLYGEMNGESRSVFRLNNKNSTNIQMKDIEIDIPAASYRPITIGGTYWRIQNVDGMENWANFGGIAGIVEDCYMRACVGPSVNGFYFARNENFGTGGNNKELMTTDGGPRVFKKGLQYIGDDPEEMKKAGLDGVDTNGKVTYKLVGASANGDQYWNHTVAITSGQGLGQVRRITWQNGIYFQVDNPFAIEPNRNGTITIHHPRMNMQFINSKWKSGDAVGTYGAMFNGVFDGNEFRDFGTQVFDNHEGPVWYITNINALYTDPVYVHGDGAGITLHEEDIYSLAIKLGGSENFGNIGWSWRNCQINGYWFEIGGGTNMNSLEGLVIENNTVNYVCNNHYAVTLRCGENIYNNVLIRNNIFNVDQPYSREVTENINTTLNKHGSYKIMDDVALPSGLRENMGDVNRDGKVTLQDASCIRQYMAGLLELDGEQILYGDVNKDGAVDLKDAAQIRKFVESGTPFLNSSGDIEAEY